MTTAIDGRAMMTVAASCEARDILQAAVARLRDGGVETARLDARLLLAEALGRKDAVLPHETLPAWSVEAAGCFDALIDRRLAGEPVSRIRGWREFWSLEFALSADTLDPRPDSEALVAAAVQLGRENRTSHILDLGTGSGCLLLACLDELPVARGVGIDLSAGAVAVAAENASRLGLADRSSFHQASFADDLSAHGRFDMVLSNPPYIPTAEIEGLSPEVARFDPALALDGGEDGFAAWRQLLPTIAAMLSSDGVALVEIGAGQQDEVAGIAATAGLNCVGQHEDLTGIIRCLVLSAS